jgi:hypothetical protein
MSRAKAAILALSGVFFVCAQSSQTAASEPISWSDMIWDALTTGGQSIAHAALLVDVRLDSVGIPATMQLDTGADQDMLYTNTYNSLRPKDTPSDKYWIGLTGTVAGRPFKGDWFAHSDQGGPVPAGKTPLLGTIGAAFFEKRILLLDFVAQRLAILGKGEDLPAEFAQRMEFVPLEYRNSKMFVAVTLNGVEDREMFFDTGSSSMAVLTTRQRWLELTGAQPDDPHNTEILGSTWGKPVRWAGAPLKNKMSIGKVVIDRPLVYFEPTGLPNFDFDKYPYKTSGLFGNVAFDGRFTVAIDLPHRRFGIFEGSLATPPAK